MITEGFQYMVLGMGFVFAFLGIMILFMGLMSKIVGWYDTKFPIIINESTAKKESWEDIAVVLAAIKAKI